MPNRIFTKTVKLDDGREKTSRQLVANLLVTDGEKTLGEIKKFLAQNSIMYSDNRGLVNLLESMRKSGEIGKHKIAGKSYPTYYKKKRDLADLSSLGNEFTRNLPAWLRDYPSIPKHRSESDAGFFVRMLIRIFGIYSLFVIIQSWKWTSSSKSHEENYDIRNSWLRETLPFPTGSHLLNDGINDLIRAGSFELITARLYENKEKMQKLHELEKTLIKKYPQETKLYLDCFDKAKAEFKKTQKWIKNVEQLNTRKERLNRKMRKNSKKILKSNECPRCHYDGSTKVKYGQCKGMIFEKGFVLEPGIEQNGRHCPACGFWENVKNS